jgi:hypothetical protein
MKDRVPNKQKENSYFQKTFYARRWEKKMVLTYSER